MTDGDRQVGFNISLICAQKHQAWDLLSEHDHVHYDCHLRPFLYISMGSLQQKKMKERRGAQIHAQGKILRKAFCCSRGFVAALTPDAEHDILEIIIIGCTQYITTWISAAIYSNPRTGLFDSIKVKVQLGHILKPENVDRQDIFSGLP